MASVYHGRPKLVDPRPAVARPPNAACRRVAYRDGSPAECGAPTMGRTYCAECRADLMRVHDRQQPIRSVPLRRLGRRRREAHDVV